MKQWLIGLGVLFFASLPLLAQTDSTDADSSDAGNPTVNVRAIGIVAGTIHDFLTQGVTPDSAISPTCFDDNDSDGAEDAASSDEDTTADTDTSDDSADTSDDASATSTDTSDEFDNDYLCLSQALAFTGLLETFNAEGTYTLFAPTDSAFENLAASMSGGDFTALLADTEQLTQILSYHVVSEEHTLNDLFTEVASGPITLTTLQGSDLSLVFTDADPTDESSDVSNQEEVRVGSNASSTANQEGDAFVVEETVDLDNGMVIGIDGVLLPPTTDAQ
jgi:uncharacterized surface protein with fasciclin (FAS1) repeats